MIREYVGGLEPELLANLHRTSFEGIPAGLLEAFVPRFRCDRGT